MALRKPVYVGSYTYYIYSIQKLPACCINSKEKINGQMKEMVG